MKIRLLIYWTVAFSALIFSTVVVSMQSNAERQERLSAAKTAAKDSANQVDLMFQQLSQSAKVDPNLARSVADMKSYYNQIENCPDAVDEFVTVLNNSRSHVTEGLKGAAKADVDVSLVRLKSQLDYRLRVLRTNKSMRCELPTREY